MSIAAVCAAVLAPLAIRAHRGTADEFNGPQAIHSKPTSRFGGVAVIAAYFAAAVAILTLENLARRPLLPLLFCSLPLVMVGLWEDTTRRVPPRSRLVAGVASAALASMFAGGIVPRLDLPYVDDWLAFMPLALAITWFMVVGVCNAINLIDGAHGLAGGTALLLFAGLAAVAGQVGDTMLVAKSIAMIGAIAGFLLWNYPRGHIFLGDAGAYFLGFMYAEFSLQLITGNPSVSPWCPLLLAAYPIVETLFSIFRRRVLSHSAAMNADNSHLHSLVYRQLVERLARAAAANPGLSANALVAPRLWLHTAFCFAGAAVFYQSTPTLAALLVAYVLWYLLGYRRLLQQMRLQVPVGASRDS